MNTQQPNRLFSLFLYAQQALIKGWEVGILLILPLLLIFDRVSLLELGILSTVFSVFQMLFSLLSGPLNHRIGNKPMILISLLLFLIAWILLLLESVFFISIIVFALGGASAGLFETSGISLIAKSLQQGKRAGGIANFGMAGDLGRIVFTGLTSFLIGSNNFNLLIYINIFCALVMITWYFLVQNDFPKTIDTVQNQKKTGFNLYLKDRKYVLALIAGNLDSFASASLFIFLPLLFAGKGFPVEETGVLSILLFIGYMAGRKVLGKLADQKGTVYSLIVGEVSMALIIILIILVNNYTLLLLLMILLGVATRGTSPVVKALIADAVPDELIMENGVALYQSSNRLVGALSRSIFSSSAAAFGINSVFAISAIAALAVIIPAKSIQNSAPEK